LSPSAEVYTRFRAVGRCEPRERPIAPNSRERHMPDLLWIVIVVLVVLALLGYFGRGRFRG
jgi:cobalamin biosynthesis Mg chelatase CobN